MRTAARRAVLVLLSGLLLGALAMPAAAGAVVDLTAFRVRVSDHPAFVRAVVDFTDGTLGANEVEAYDPSPFDGAARLRVSHLRVQAQAPTVTASGVRVRVIQGTNQLRIGLRAQPRAFKYLSYSVLHGPERLVIDLWRSAPPTRAAEIRRGPGGCLTLTGLRVLDGRVRATGTERNLFEHAFLVAVRDRTGRVVGQRSLTATGSWQADVPYRSASRQRGTLEAVADSPKDGALACLVQAGVTLSRTP